MEGIARSIPVWELSFRREMKLRQGKKRKKRERERGPCLYATGISAIISSVYGYSFLEDRLRKREEQPRGGSWSRLADSQPTSLSFLLLFPLVNDEGWCMFYLLLSLVFIYFKSCLCFGRSGLENKKDEEERDKETNKQTEPETLIMASHPGGCHSLEDHISFFLPFFSPFSPFSLLSFSWRVKLLETTESISEERRWCCYTFPTPCACSFFTFYRKLTA